MAHQQLTVSHTLCENDGTSELFGTFHQCVVDALKRSTVSCRICVISAPLAVPAVRRSDIYQAAVNKADLEDRGCEVTQLRRWSSGVDTDLIMDN